MRNYFEALRLLRQSSSVEIRSTVDSFTPEYLADEDDLSSIMLNDQWREQYRRVHLQYEAIAAAVNSPAMHDSANTHSWDKRVVEFTPVQDTIELPQ